MNSKIGLLGKQITTAIDHAAVTVDRYGHRVPLVGSPFLSGVGVVAKGIHALGKKLFPAFFTGSSAYMTRVNNIHKKEYAHPFSGPKIAAEEIHVHRTINSLNASLKKKIKEFNKELNSINEKLQPINEDQKFNVDELAQAMVDLIPFMSWTVQNIHKINDQFDKDEFQAWENNEKNECKQKHEQFDNHILDCYKNLFSKFDSLEKNEKVDVMEEYSYLLKKRIELINNNQKSKEIELNIIKVLIKELLDSLSKEITKPVKITGEQLQDTEPLQLLQILNLTIDEYKNVNEESS